MPEGSQSPQRAGGEEISLVARDLVADDQRGKRPGGGGGKHRDPRRAKSVAQIDISRRPASA